MRQTWRRENQLNVHISSMSEQNGQELPSGIAISCRRKFRMLILTNTKGKEKEKRDGMLPAYRCEFESNSIRKIIPADQPTLQILGNMVCRRFFLNFCSQWVHLLFDVSTLLYLARTGNTIGCPHLQRSSSTPPFPS